MASAGTLHKYSSKLVAFEHGSPSEPSNLVLWIGGLGDGLLTVPYPRVIAQALPPSWSLAEVVLSASYKGWGTGSLKRDARELGDAVKYFNSQRPGKKIVLMGHSTGCQDIMEYLVGPDSSSRPAIDGAILQGGVSDREAWVFMTEEDGVRESLNAIIQQAKSLIDAGKEREVMPTGAQGNVVSKELGAPMSAYRTYSLLAPGGDDDYFSSDLSEEVLKNTFGKIPASTPVQFLLGELDPFVMPTVNRADLIARFTKIIRDGGGVVDDKNGGVVPGAHHNLDGDPEDVVQDLAQRVVKFTEFLDSGSSTNSHL
jgi:hypothetical protein